MTAEEETGIPQDARDWNAPIDDSQDVKEYGESLTPEQIRSKEKQRMVKFALVAIDVRASEHQNDPDHKARIAQEFLLCQMKYANYMLQTLKVPEFKANWQAVIEGIKDAAEELRRQGLPLESVETNELIE